MCAENYNDSLPRPSPTLCYGEGLFSSINTAKGPIPMAIDIHYVTSENAHEAFLNRVIDRFCQINPTIDPERMEPYIGYLFDYTIADLDILASILIVDVEWLLTGHGWCPPISRKYRH